VVYVFAAYYLCFLHGLYRVLVRLVALLPPHSHIAKGAYATIIIRALLHSYDK
jgi:hypothetical protein